MSAAGLAATALRSEAAAGGGLAPVAQLDGGAQRRAKPQAHAWSFTGTATALQFDQVPYYNKRTDVALGAAYILGAPTAPVGWTAAEVATYIADNPAPLANMHFTAASVATLLERALVQFARQTPDASSQSEQIPLSDFVSDMRFDKTVLSVGINGEPLDGYTFPRVITPGAASPNSYNLTFNFGQSVDRRADVPATAAKVVTPVR